MERGVRRVRVAVYTISLNEEAFVERWYESAKDADVVLLADTGSTDRTVEIARSIGVQVVEIAVVPWRFDDARNAALAAIPRDIDMCINLDVDEILAPGWRAPLEAAFAAGITRPRYRHIWSWNEDGSPGLELSHDRVHLRTNYRWRHPVHECLYPYAIEEKSGWMDGFEIHHHPDPTKSRSQYLPLLALSVEEEPHSDRNVFYYGRELYFHGRYDEAAVQLKKHLSMPTARWAPERAASMRMIGRCIPQEAELWYRMAIDQAPGRREPYIDLAEFYFKNSDWTQCLAAAQGALAITEKLLDYQCEPIAWGAAPWDYAAISSYWLGHYEDAIRYGQQALVLEPNNERFQQNMAYYLTAKPSVQP